MSPSFVKNYHCAGAHSGPIQLERILWSCEKGCVSCVFIRDLISHIAPEWTLDFDSTMATNESKLLNSLTLHSKRISIDNIGHGWQLHEGDRCIQSFSLHHKSQDSHRFVVRSPPRPISLIEKYFGSTLTVAADTTSAMSFDRARTWLADCVRNHAACEVTRWLHPRRLLLVGRRGTGIIKLVDSSREPNGPLQYACLSYCWGKDASGVLTTTRETVAQHYRGISVEALPKTIADAVRICQELRIPYLWVDSLCIIQGDKEDFGREGYHMDAIYSGSHLTIYAKAAVSCKDGFLGKQTFGSDGWQYPALGGLAAPSGLEFFIRRGEVREGPMPVDTRAWCFQEEVLPKRRLIYRGDEMEWRCSEDHICECGHVRVPKDGDPSNRRPLRLDEVEKANRSESTSFRKRLLDRLVRSLGDERGPVGDHVEQWQSLVREYSPRLLTVPTDKLMAISGIAKRLLENAAVGTGGGRDTYRAGLWGSKLVQQLLWWSVDHSIDIDLRAASPKHLPLDNGVPSWSWASIQGPVAYMDPPSNSSRMARKNVARVQDVSVRLVFPSIPTGPVDGGYIILKAPITPVELAVVVGWDVRDSDSVGEPAESSLWRSRQRAESAPSTSETPIGLIRPRSSDARSGGVILWDYEIVLDIVPSGVVVFDGDDKRFRCWTQGKCEGEGCDCESLAMEGRFFCLQVLDWVEGEEHAREGASDRETVNAWKLVPETRFLMLEKVAGKDTYLRVGAGRSLDWSIFWESTTEKIKII